MIDKNINKSVHNENINILISEVDELLGLWYI